MCHRFLSLTKKLKNSSSCRAYSILSHSFAISVIAYSCTSFSHLKDLKNFVLFLVSYSIVQCSFKPSPCRLRFPLIAWDMIDSLINTLIARLAAHTYLQQLFNRLYVLLDFCSMLIIKKTSYTPCLVFARLTFAMLCHLCHIPLGALWQSEWCSVGECFPNNTITLNLTRAFAKMLFEILAECRYIDIAHFICHLCDIFIPLF